MLMGVRMLAVFKVACRVIDPELQGVAMIKDSRRVITGVRRHHDRSSTYSHHRLAISVHSSIRTQTDYAKHLCG